MKKFDFKLQKLLEIRQKKEDQEKIELSRASGAYQFVFTKKKRSFQMSRLPSII